MKLINRYLLYLYPIFIYRKTPTLQFFIGEFFSTENNSKDFARNLLKLESLPLPLQQSHKNSVHFSQQLHLTFCITKKQNKKCCSNLVLKSDNYNTYTFALYCYGIYYIHISFLHHIPLRRS